MYFIVLFCFSNGQSQTRSLNLMSELSFGKMSMEKKMAEISEDETIGIRQAKEQ